MKSKNKILTMVALFIGLSLNAQSQRKKSIDFDAGFYYNSISDFSYNVGLNMAWRNQTNKYAIVAGFFVSHTEAMDIRWVSEEHQKKYFSDDNISQFKGLVGMIYAQPISSKFGCSVEGNLTFIKQHLEGLYLIPCICLCLTLPVLLLFA